MARTVLVVDDHPGFRRMAGLLLRSGGYDVLGEVGTAAEALSAAEALEPDVVLLDVLLPDGDGVEVAEALAGLARPPAVVLVSSRQRSELSHRLAGSSALGFLPKDELTLSRVVELLG